MRTVLNKKFFLRKTSVVAKELLGKFLVRTRGSKTYAGMITEVEAYDGFYDKASHASRGQTPRNAPMFQEGGIWYVYFTYGMHWMLNIVTREKGYPAAILIRGICIDGVPAERTNGPAKLTTFLHIDKRLNAVPAAPHTGLWMEDRGVNIKPRDMARGERIGVDYAGRWKHKHWRFNLIFPEKFARFCRTADRE